MIQSDGLEQIIDLRDRFNGSYSARDRSAIRYVVIHHSGADVDSMPEEIDAYHKTLVDSYGNPWPGIGYHVVVRQTGEVYYVGDVLTTRASVYGRNREVFSIVLTGDFTSVCPLDDQLSGARLAVRFAKQMLGDSIPVVGHKDVALSVSPTACPGDRWAEWRDRII